MTDKLEPFDGREVAASTISVTRAGDGLSEALSIEPQEFHHGQTVYVVLETTVGKIVHRPIDAKAPDILVREHVLVAGTGTIVDREAVEHLVAQQEARNADARAAREVEERRQKGNFTLVEAEHDVAHDKGDHAADLVKGCPKCDAEVAAVKAETTDDLAPPPPPAKKAAAKKAPAKKAAAAKKDGA